MPTDTTPFDSLLEAVPDAMLGVDHEGLICFVNHQAESLFGYDRDDLVGQPVEMLIPDNLRQIHRTHRQHYVAEPHSRFMGTGPPLTARERDGTEFPANISLSLVNSEDVFVIVAIRDVRHWAKAAKDLLLLAGAVQGSDEAIISTAPDGIITNWNPAAEKLFGYSREEIIGSSVELLSPGGQPGQSAVTARFRAGRPAAAFETTLVRKDGGAITGSLSISPVLDGSSVVSTFAIARDVTKSKDALESAQRLASIVESSANAIIGSTLEGIITSWNPAAERVYGYSSAEVIGRSVMLLSPPSEQEKARDAVAQLLAGGASPHYETVSVRKDGTTFRDSLTLSPIRGEDGTIVGISAITHEVTSGD